MMGGYKDNIIEGVEFHELDCCDLQNVQPQNNVNTIRFILNCVYGQNLDYRENIHYEKLMSKNRKIECVDIEEMLKEFTNMFKSILPKMIKLKDKYLALAIEGLWKFLMMIIENIMNKTVVKV